MFKLGDLQEMQSQLALTYSDFLKSLDEKHTVTLSELLSAPKALEKIDASWLNRRLLARRLKSMCEFFSEIENQKNLPKQTPLVFFQSSPQNEDFWVDEQMTDGRTPRSLCFYKKSKMARYPQVAYLHLDTNFYYRTQGSWDLSNRRIYPLNTYANMSWRGVFREKPVTKVPPGAILGYRIPNYPLLLGVSATTATDYLARMVIHDIGHRFLPSIKRSLEPYHNAVMCHAMQATSVAHTDPFENLVHRECCDPYFPAVVQDFVEKCKAKSLAQVQLYYLRKLQQALFGKQYRAFHRLWGVNPRERESVIRVKMKQFLEAIIRNEFVAYEI